jgi:hypothetical protein
VDRQVEQGYAAATGEEPVRIESGEFIITKKPRTPQWPDRDDALIRDVVETRRASIEDALTRINPAADLESLRGIRARFPATERGLVDSALLLMLRRVFPTRSLADAHAALTAHGTHVAWATLAGTAAAGPGAAGPGGRAPAPTAPGRGSAPPATPNVATGGQPTGQRQPGAIARALREAFPAMPTTEVDGIVARVHSHTQPAFAKCLAWCKTHKVAAPTDPAAALATTLARVQALKAAGTEPDAAHQPAPATPPAGPPAGPQPAPGAPGAHAAQQHQRMLLLPTRTKRNLTTKRSSRP